MIMNKKNTFQQKNWEKGLGNKYTLRNPLNPKEFEKVYRQNFGISRTNLNNEFLGRLSRSLKILEVGSNVGTQLMYLQKMGFKNLYGIEINRKAIELSKLITKKIDVIQGSALDIPFKDGYFDLVFTSGVLIHISPIDIKKVMKEIHRCSNKYIWGFEYYADKYTKVIYRGKKNLLWKANFPEVYCRLFKNLKLVKEKKIKYLKSENVDIMFLLKKRSEKK